jgi:hypothetical protein
MVCSCSITLFDTIFTGSLLYILFISDLVFTFVNLYALKRLFPKTYLMYEQNLIIKRLVRWFGIKKAVFIYSVLGVILFTILWLWIPIHAGILVGFLFGLVLLIHIPNFFEIRKRLRKRGGEKL